MENTYLEALNTIKEYTDIRPEVALVLGSGLGELADTVQNRIEVPYLKIPGFLRSTVPGHAGKLVLGKLAGKNCVCMQGRFHYYEGYRQTDIVFPIRLFKLLGVKTLVLTNACGGVNLGFKAGDLMMITDHMNLSGSNPLMGPNNDDFGPRFPDMSYVYSKSLQASMRKAASSMGLDLKEGVYAMLSGPSLKPLRKYACCGCWAPMWWACPPYPRLLQLPIAACR
jgi:inosine guanosine and xanthosine phosphorylase family